MFTSLKQHFATNMPEDNFILLSFINTKLRDEYDSLDELCASMQANKEEILERLQGIGYRYSEDDNQFR